MLYIQNILPAFAIGYVLDLILGDPHGMWHPICFVGNMISFFEKLLRSQQKEQKPGKTNARQQRLAGVFLVILVLLCTVVLAGGVLFVCYWLHPIVGLLMQSYMSYTILATKSLRTESMKVQTALQNEGLEAGRYAVSMIVGRDTASLDEVGVTKAAVETVAENASDGVVAPLLFLAIGGPVLGFFYKAVNTMDSMVGYKNEKYRYFGTAAARFDDVLNYLPARLSALLMIAAAGLLPHFSGKEAHRIWRRDRRNHASPNSAQTEAVMAGALGVQLAGDAYYFGELHHKPTIGDAQRAVETDDIRRANMLMYASSLLAFLVFGVIRFLLQWSTL